MARKNEPIIEDLEPEQENLPAEISAPSNSDAALSKVVGFGGGAQTALYTSLDMGTKEGKILAGKALNQADMNADMFRDKPFPVANVLMHVIYLPVEDDKGEPTGEMEPLPRTVLIGENGQTAQFVSLGIARSLQNLFGLWGKPPWTPALTVKLRQITTRKGRTYNLEVVD